MVVGEPPSPPAPRVTLTWAPCAVPPSAHLGWGTRPEGLWPAVLHLTTEPRHPAWSRGHCLARGLRDSKPPPWVSLGLQAWGQRTGLPHIYRRPGKAGVWSALPTRRTHVTDWGWPAERSPRAPGRSPDLVHSSQAHVTFRSGRALGSPGGSRAGGPGHTVPGSPRRAQATSWRPLSRLAALRSPASGPGLDGLAPLGWCWAWPGGFGQKRRGSGAPGRLHLLPRPGRRVRERLRVDLALAQALVLCRRAGLCEGTARGQSTGIVLLEAGALP